MHIDVATQDNLVVRISFSNLFKEFKSTSTWLQFPFLCNTPKGSVHSLAAVGSKGNYYVTFTLSISVELFCQDINCKCFFVFFLQNIEVFVILFKRSFNSLICPLDKNCEHKTSDHGGVAPLATRWTVLCMDFNHVLSLYLNRRFSYLKSVRLCANMMVKNIFTSDNLYEPGKSL